MARQKKSLLGWLTGGGDADDYSFDDLETGSGELPSRTRRMTPEKRPLGTLDDEPLSAEEPMDGELSVDVYQTPSHIIVKAMIAGVKPDDLDVTITRDMVTIRGKREQHTEGSAGDFFFQELYWGSFSRTIVLPQEVEVEEAEASEKHGLLIIRLPKLDKGRQAKLKVKSS
jgi:HSP20 family protein